MKKITFFFALLACLLPTLQAQICEKINISIDPKANYAVMRGRTDSDWTDDINNPINTQNEMKLDYLYVQIIDFHQKLTEKNF